MTDDSKKLRLDQILIYEGLITEEQVKQALLDQKERGGKFGSQLLYNRFIDETTLVKALAKQLNCKAVILSNLLIPTKILELIPAKFAVARKVIPFDYDLKNGIIKFACDAPNDKDLIKELTFVTGNQKIELYLAADLVLNTSIAKHYLDYDTDKLENYLLELPKIYDDYMYKQFALESTGTVTKEEKKEIILLVTDDQETRPMLSKLFVLDGFQVVTKESADDAIESLGKDTYHSVYIQDSVSGDYIDLIDRLRKISPSTQVRYYESVTSLFLDQSTHRVSTDLMTQNLELFTTLLTDKEQREHNHNSIVGQYARKLCEQIGLPYKDRISVINTAYMHDFAKFYYPGNKEKSDDPRLPIEKTVKLLQSLNYPPVIIEMLKSMYIDLKKKYTRRLPIEALGGNIITICDLFCQNINVDERLSLDKFDKIVKKINDLTGNLFLTEVASAFIKMIEKEIMKEVEKVPFNQIMVYYQDANRVQTLETRLKSENFRIISADSTNTILELYKRCHPDFILIILEGSAENTKNEIEKINALGLDFKDAPTFVLTDLENVAHLTPLFEKGVEDILLNEGNVELLIAKLRKIQSELIHNSNNKNSLSEEPAGTQGKLSDMDLIDLIQIIGNNRRTVRLTVYQSDKNQSPLIIYLDKGQLTFAQLDEIKGAEAVYKAIGWKDGNWKVETLEDSEIPEPNNDLPNESILMEGCRLLDETKRVDQHAEQT